MKVAGKKQFPPLKPSEDELKEVWTIFGEKGVGKTVAALGLSREETVAISFDGMTERVRMNQLYDHRDKITVYDPTKPDPENGWKGWVRTEEEITETSSDVYDYAIHILDQIIEQGGVDTIVIDGLELAAEIFEMKMRYHGKLGPMDGVRNLNLWKLRKLYYNELYKKALAAANNRLIYTTYTKFYEYEEGGTITKQKRPKYADMTEWKSDIVLEVFSVMNKNKSMSLGTGKVKPASFYARFYSNKLDRMYPETGTQIEFTDQLLIDVIKEEMKNDGTQQETL